MIHLRDRFSRLQPRETLARTQVLERGWPFFLDLCVAAIGLACFYARHPDCHVLGRPS